jgi:hypothetical protein
MSRKKQKLTPKVEPVDIKPPVEPPKRAPSKGRPRSAITLRDHYLAAILSGLLSKPYREGDQENIKKEANRWADLMLKED